MEVVGLGWCGTRTAHGAELAAFYRDVLRLPLVHHEPGFWVFRLVDGDARTMALMESVNASGTAYLSHTKVEGRTALRLATGSWRTTDADVDRTWEALVALLPR